MGYETFQMIAEIAFVIIAGIAIFQAIQKKKK